VEDNWEKIGRAHLEQTRRQLEYHICKTNARQLGGKWEIFTPFERHWETTGRQMEDTWRLFLKTDPGGQIGRQLDNNRTGDTASPVERGHLCDSAGQSARPGTYGSPEQGQEVCQSKSFPEQPFPESYTCIPASTLRS